MTIFQPVFCYSESTEMSIRWVWLVVAIDRKAQERKQEKDRNIEGKSRDTETDTHGRDWTKSYGRNH